MAKWDTTEDELETADEAGNLPGALSLTSSQRKYLRGLAHELKPVALIGKGGVSDGLIASIDLALGAHELIKVKFNDLKDEKAEILETLTAALGAAHAGTIGHVAVLYRPAKERKERKIRLPGGEAGQ